MTIKLYDEVLEITNFTTLTQMNEMLAKFKLQPLTVQTKPLYINPNGNLYTITNYFKEDETLNYDLINALLSLTVKDPIFGSGTANERFGSFYQKQLKELKSYQDSNDINGYAANYFLKCNANIYRNGKVPFSYYGVYNDTAKEIINGNIESIKCMLYSLKMLLNNFENYEDLISKLFEIFKINYDYEKFKDNYGKSEIEYYKLLFSQIADDFLVQFMNFDKIETSMSKTITTSKLNVNETFYNYLLMDYNIKVLPKIVYNKEMKKFEEIIPNKFIEIGSDAEALEEIESIKKYCKKDERHKFIK